jgi:hypothetical protein
VLALLLVLYKVNYRGRETLVRDLNRLIGAFNQPDNGRYCTVVHHPAVLCFIILLYCASSSCCTVVHHPAVLCFTHPGVLCFVILLYCGASSCCTVVHHPAILCFTHPAVLCCVTRAQRFMLCVV